jgi:uncharacterized protein
MMPIFERIIKLKNDSRRKSFFFFGPRQTGKTFLLKKIFPNALFYNLLLSDVFLKLSQRPQIIREEIEARGKKVPQPVIIDEIQKLPVLLDEVQHLIEEKKIRFILTGSSPRKLKRGGGNLLGGRAWQRHLFPLVTAEIPQYDLLRILNFGAIPSIYNSKHPKNDLSAYVGTYLQEEIQAERLVRRIENFSRFLQTAALYNAELLNFANVASDAAVPQRTVMEYFAILQDTLMGDLLEPFQKTKKRKAVATAKFYFFDVGVCNCLAGRQNIRPKTELFGKVLEHFIFTELKAFLAYTHHAQGLSFWRSQSGYEVDFLIGDRIAIEVKATEMVSEKHLSGVRALAEEMSLTKRIVVSLDAQPRKIKGIDIIPVQTFLKHLWKGQIA